MVPLIFLAAPATLSPSVGLRFWWWTATVAFFLRLKMERWGRVFVVLVVVVVVFVVWEAIACVLVRMNKGDIVGGGCEVMGCVLRFRGM